MGEKRIQGGGVVAPGSRAAMLSERLRRPGRPLLLDGATGTELERAGLRTGLPLWSTHALLEAPDAVRRIHCRYVEAGAELITANTFRTQRRTLARAGLGERDAELTALAVELARGAIAEARTRPESAYVAGSMPPLEDCYRPDLVPDEGSLEKEHVRQANLLAEAGADLILVETMGSAREATIASQAAVATGLPVVVGFVSWERDRILSGESLREAASRVLDVGVAVVGVNCVPPAMLPDALACLAPLGAPLMASPNLGEPNAETGFTRSEGVSGDDFSSLFEPWLDGAEPRARLVGGCCGTRPEHIAALARRLAIPTETTPPGPGRGH